MTTQLRVGVIGLGFAGHTALQCFHALPNARVVALSGQEADRLAELGEAHDVPHLFASYEELLALPELDAISIAVPNHLHAPIALAAFERGLHVLCEKPLARNATEAEAMVEAARRAGRVLQVVFNHRERGDVELLGRSIAEGGLGRIYFARAWWVRRRGIPGANSWFVSREVAGGGCLIDLGVHVLDIALHLLGQPEVLSVSASTFDELGRRGLGVSPSSGKTGSGNAFDVEDTAVAFLRLAGGVAMTLETSWASHSSAQDDYGVALLGVDGGAEIRAINYSADDSLRLYANVAGQPAEIRPRLPRGGYHGAVVRRFVDRVLSGEWEGCDGREALRYARVIDACYESARSGREVLLSEGPPGPWAYPAQPPAPAPGPDRL